jgi:RimJ/RimL family protein N-acetyltransferase
MIPSSPSITIEEQQKVVDVISQFVFLNQHIKIVRIDNSNIDILNHFIKQIDDKHFRYFDRRTSDCIVNHVVTFLFYDITQDEYFGYTHIDYDNESKKNWFGIYLDQAYRGKKLGNLLLNYTIHSCNLDIIHLSVDADNENAIKLYIKNGFVIEQTKNDIHYCTKYIEFCL